MILCEWDGPEGDPGQSCVHLYARILSSSLTSVSIFSVSCYSIVSISMVYTPLRGQRHSRCFPSLFPSSVEATTGNLVYFVS